MGHRVAVLVMEELRQALLCQDSIHRLPEPGRKWTLLEPWRPPGTLESLPDKRRGAGSAGAEMPLEPVGQEGADDRDELRRQRFAARGEFARESCELAGRQQVGEARASVGGVTGEHFVAPLSVEHDPNPCTCG